MTTLSFAVFGKVGLGVEEEYSWPSDSSCLFLWHLLHLMLTFPQIGSYLEYDLSMLAESSAFVQVL